MNFFVRNSPDSLVCSCRKGLASSPSNQMEFQSPISCVMQSLAC